MAGGTVARTPHFALHRLLLSVPLSIPTPASASGPQALFAVADFWCGAMAPKRWARRAVTRNAIKRQIYTVAPLFVPQWQPAAYVVRLRASFQRKEFTSASSPLLKQAVRAELHQLFEQVAPLPLPPLLGATL